MSILSLALGILPGFAWLFFYLQEDLRPEPKRMIALVFLAGVLSAILALFAELFINCGVFYGFQDCFQNLQKGAPLTATLVLIFALIEEMAKFGAAYFAVRKSKYFDEPVDAMIYMAVAALGFATLENIGALFGKGNNLALLSGVFEIATFRFVGTTLLHTLTSSLIGYYWAQSIRNLGKKRLLINGVILGTVLHAVFNYLIIIYGNLLYPIIFVVTIGFFILGDFEKLRYKKV